MCGIFGFIDNNKNQERESISILKDMAASIKYRGPDDEGFFINDTLAIGNVRLSIIDIKNGHQPFLSDDGNVALIQNGEIYNYKEIRSELIQTGHSFRTESDTEVLLKSYEEWGAEFIHKLNGMFAIAIYDKRSRKLLLFRDRVGIKPLYYYHKDDQFIFASEIKAILATGIQRKSNEIALHHFLSFNYTPTPYSFFKDIYELKAGNWIELDQDNIKSDINERAWWGLENISIATPSSEDEICENINYLLSEAVRIRLRSDVEVGAFLSGGVDSSSVTAIASKTNKIKTFSIGFEDKRYDESDYAEIAAKRFNTDHYNKILDTEHVLKLWKEVIYHCDQPHGDVSFIPTYCVSEFASDHLKVVLTGDGGDELFAGYDKYKLIENYDLSDKESTDWQRRYFDATSLLSHSQKSHLYGDKMRTYLDTDSFELAEATFNKFQHQDTINQILAFDSLYLLSGNNLVKPDRTGMANSIEARMPFLDYRLIEYAFSLSGEYKLRDNETKYILKKAVKGLIGGDLAYRKKQMFTVPIGDWFRGRLSGFTKGILLSDSFNDRGLFKREALDRMIDSHISGMENHTRILRALIAVELWFRIFIDGDDFIENAKALNISP